MDNFKTVASVIAVLAAFTAFQLIGNHSLRKAVRADVRHQIATAENKSAQLSEEVRKAAEQAKALAAELAIMNTSLDETAKLLKALSGATQSLAEKTADAQNAVDKLPASAESAINSLANIQQDAKSVAAAMNAAEAQCTQLSTRLGDASKAGETSAGATRQAQADIAKLSDTSAQALKQLEATLGELRANIEKIRGETQRLSDELIKLKAGQQGN